MYNCYYINISFTYKTCENLKVILCKIKIEMHLGLHPINPEVVGSIPHLGTYLCCGFGS